MGDRDKLIEALMYDLRAAIAKHTSLSGDEVYDALSTVADDYAPEDPDEDLDLDDEDDEYLDDEDEYVEEEEEDE